MTETMHQFLVIYFKVGWYVTFQTKLTRLVELGLQQYSGDLYFYPRQRNDMRCDCAIACIPAWHKWKSHEIKTGATAVKAETLEECQKACVDDINCKGVNVQHVSGSDSTMKADGCSTVDFRSDGKMKLALWKDYYQLIKNCLRGQ